MVLVPHAGAYYTAEDNEGTLMIPWYCGVVIFLPWYTVDQDLSFLDSLDYSIYAVTIFSHLVDWEDSFDVETAINDIVLASESLAKRFYCKLPA